VDTSGETNTRCKNISDESERANGDCYIGRDIKQVKKERDC
jgi:hypothetical protein